MHTLFLDIDGVIYGADAVTLDIATGELSR